MPDDGLSLAKSAWSEQSDSDCLRGETSGEQGNIFS